MKGKLFALLLLIAFSKTSSLWSQYSIQLQKPNVIALKTADLWNIILQNNGNNDLPAYLTGTIVEKSRGKLYEIKSGDFTFRRGTSMYNTTNYNDLKGEKATFTDRAFEEHILRTNTLPNGNYTFCATIFDVKSNQQLASNCMQVLINQVTPPLLMFPMNNATVCETQPLFVWERFRGALDNNSLTYKIKVVEILKSQKAASAIQSNPCYYCQDYIPNPPHQFSFKALPFQDGRRYAWAIVVTSVKQDITISEIWEFTWKKCGDSGTGDGQTDEEEEEVEVVNPAIDGVGYYYFSDFEGNNIVNIEKSSVNFRMINYGMKETVSALIVADISKPILQKELVLNNGHNYYSIDLKTVKLQLDKVYILKLATASGKYHQLQFTQSK